jgi:hypothetical protein
MCGREKRRFRECAVGRDENSFAASESSSTAVMLSARSSKVGIAGSDTPVPGWSKKMSRPSEVIASNQPWIDGSSGKTSQFVNRGETTTLSRGPSRDARYATRKSPFIAYRVSENIAEV